MIRSVNARGIGLGLISLLAALVVVLSLSYFSFEPRGILLNKAPEVLGTWIYQLGFYAHISLGMVALLLGPLQFMPGLRRQSLSRHRLIGKIYLMAVLVSAISGFGIAWFADHGWVSKLGFVGMSVAWLFTLVQAYRDIRQRKIDAHQVWMIRNYAITFSAVSLRLGLLLALVGWVQFATIYQIVAWASWILNLMVAEWIIRSHKRLKAYSF